MEENNGQLVPQGGNNNNNSNNNNSNNNNDNNAGNNKVVAAVSRSTQQIFEVDEADAPEELRGANIKLDPSMLKFLLGNQRPENKTADTLSRIQNLQRERDALLEQAASKDVEIKRLTKKLEAQLGGENKAQVGLENVLKKKFGK